MTALEDALSAGAHIGQPNGRATPELISAALTDSVLEAAHWEQALSSSLTERTQQGDYTHGKVAEALAGLTEIQGYARLIPPSAPAPIQLTTFQGLRAVLLTTREVAPAQLLHVASQNIVTEGLRLAHFAESMVARCESAKTRLDLVQVHTDTTRMQWLSIANTTRAQSIYHLADYAVPILHSIDADLKALLVFVKAYVAADPNPWGYAQWKRKTS